MSEKNETIFVEHLEQCLTAKKSMYPVLHFIIPLAQELLTPLALPTGDI